MIVAATEYFDNTPKKLSTPNATLEELGSTIRHPKITPNQAS